MAAGGPLRPSTEARGGGGGCGGDVHGGRQGTRHTAEQVENRRLRLSLYPRGWRVRSGEERLIVKGASQKERERERGGEGIVRVKRQREHRHVVVVSPG